MFETQVIQYIWPSEIPMPESIWLSLNLIFETQTNEFICLSEIQTPIFETQMAEFILTSEI